MQRLHHLDYLRGLAAFSIMAFHYTTWTLGEQDASTLLGRFGIYGVSIFYVLSGLTLTYVYQHRFTPTLSFLKTFFKKRIFRIFPLLIMATILSVRMMDGPIDPVKLMLNVTGLFGFVSWDSYYATGVWSIGNELVFYCFFPLAIWLSRRSRIDWWGFLAGTFVLFLVYANWGYPSHSSFAYVGSVYTNPLNHLFLFCAGIALARYFPEKGLREIARVFILLVCVVLFVVLPVYGDRINLISGLPRVMLSLSCIGICFALFKWNRSIPSIPHKILLKLGEWSYSLYLMHPIVYHYTGVYNKTYFGFSETIRLNVSILLSIGLSGLVYHYFERFFVRLGAGKITWTPTKVVYPYYTGLPDPIRM